MQITLREHFFPPAVIVQRLAGLDILQSVSSPKTYDTNAFAPVFK